MGRSQRVGLPVLRRPDVRARVAHGHADTPWSSTVSSGAIVVLPLLIVAGALWTRDSPPALGGAAATRAFEAHLGSSKADTSSTRAGATRTATTPRTTRTVSTAHSSSATLATRPASRTRARRGGSRSTPEGESAMPSRPAVRSARQARQAGYPDAWSDSTGILLVHTRVRGRSMTPEDERTCAGRSSSQPRAGRPARCPTGRCSSGPTARSSPRTGTPSRATATSPPIPSSSSPAGPAVS